MAHGDSTAPWAKSRDERFAEFVKRTDSYNAAVVAAGDEPWHKDDLQVRRDLWDRRFRRPEPTKSLSIPSVQGLN
ncbi:hypothetical protein [Mycolicibacter hiberniae]|uniref:Uncharacterized protein n=1 Tax=Mycolicibacter hiberniae TaxID=29314 RepID=A0A7I7X4Y6_9MYCO|nr:hypothetical protein [Mycolicibacter hiberniae]MCV7088158.1 hypothetical protein [Mycolicibacter hiberniae]BBZ23903.1 hypothetical protein MHIB_23210 [Mycolicibacter hiberniae]